MPNNQPYTGSTIADCGRAVDAATKPPKEMREEVRQARNIATAAYIANRRLGKSHKQAREDSKVFVEDRSATVRAQERDPFYFATPCWAGPFDAMIEAIWGQP